MIAGEDYKRASGLMEAPAAMDRPQPGVPACALRLSWALSCVAAVPTPDLAQRLAAALIELCGPDKAVAVQLGRLDEDGLWRCEASGVAGRFAASGELALEPPKALPWPVPPAPSEAMAFYVSEPPSAEPSLRPIVAAMRRVNLDIELAALACSGRRGGIVLTVQIGGQRTGQTRSRAAMLHQVLPWALSIARTALGEGEGLSPRGWLTQRERQVLEQLVCGSSVVEIAKSLDRSPYTVHDHVKSLHRKLGVRTRAALVGCATLGVPPPAAQH